jgi:hypothetical protein
VSNQWVLAVLVCLSILDVCHNTVVDVVRLAITVFPDVPCLPQVTAQILAAFGVERCSDLIASRGLLAALFSPISSDFFLRAGLGLGAASHCQAVADGEVARKGISCERTFCAISAPADLEAKAQSVCLSVCLSVCRLGYCAREQCCRAAAAGALCPTSHWTTADFRVQFGRAWLLLSAWLWLWLPFQLCGRWMFA